MSNYYDKFVVNQADDKEAFMIWVEPIDQNLPWVMLGIYEDEEEADRQAELQPLNDDEYHITVVKVLFYPKVNA